MLNQLEQTCSYFSQSGANQNRSWLGSRGFSRALHGLLVFCFKLRLVRYVANICTQEFAHFRTPYLSTAFCLSCTASLYIISNASCGSHSPLASLFLWSFICSISLSFSFSFTFKLATSSSVFFDAEFTAKSSSSRLSMFSWALHNCCLKF